jgi:hypothetical protein
MDHAMKIHSLSLEVKPISGFKESPSFTGLQVLPNGDLIVGAAFGRPLLRKISWKGEGVPGSVEDLKLEQELGEDALAVVGGFKDSEKGDVDLVVLHDGSFPLFVRSLMGKVFASKTGEELVDFLDKQTGAMGVQSSHLQYVDSKFKIRRFKEPGMTWDIHFLGDFVFGLSPNEMWREPYLHLQIEKRETLRKDLKGNRKLHRGDDGTFWVMANNGRLMRFQYTENKAKPTPLKIPTNDDRPGFLLSAASRTDAWLYGVAGNARTLFRLRRNPVSMEEEIQKIWDAPEPISSLCAWDRDEKALLLVSTVGAKEAQLWSFDIVQPEDAEALPEVPQAQFLGVLGGLPRVSALTPDNKNACVWAAEGYFGSNVQREALEKLRLLRITDV